MVEKMKTFSLTYLCLYVSESQNNVIFRHIFVYFSASLRFSTIINVIAIYVAVMYNIAKNFDKN